MSEKHRVGRSCENCQHGCSIDDGSKMYCYAGGNYTNKDGPTLVAGVHFCTDHEWKLVTADDRQEAVDILRSKASSPRPTCKTCEWFTESSSICDNCGSSADGYHLDGCSVANSQCKVMKRQIGSCRKKSPSSEGFPPMFSIDWCGDHSEFHKQSEYVAKFFGIPDNRESYCQSVCCDPGFYKKE